MPVLRALVKFNMCVPPASKEWESTLSWAGPGRKGPGRKGGGLGGGREQKPLALPSSLLPCGRCVPGGAQARFCVCVCLYKRHGTLNAAQESPSKEPCGEVFCKVKNPFVRRIIVLCLSALEAQCSEVLRKKSDLFEGHLAPPFSSA